MDGGPIYISEKISLKGNLSEIFKRLEKKVIKFIFKIISENKKPLPQQGKPFVFKRRRPEESKLNFNLSITSIYDQIRMLDGLSYPNAFLKNGKYKLEFQNAKMNNDKLKASVTITKDTKESKT